MLFFLFHGMFSSVTLCFGLLFLANPHAPVFTIEIPTTDLSNPVYTVTWKQSYSSGLPVLVYELGYTEVWHALFYNSRLYSVHLKSICWVVVMQNRSKPVEFQCSMNSIIHNNIRVSKLSSTCYLRLVKCEIKFL